MKHEHFKILGGGIAGLAAAIALARQGHSVEILEKTARFESFGAAIQLGPNAVRALQKIGAWDAVQPATYAPPALHFRNGTSGKLIKEVKLGAGFDRLFGQPYRVIFRADLHAALLQVVKTLPKIKVTMGVTADPSTFGGTVIAADGIWSKTRAQLFPDSGVSINSTILFRAMIEMPKQAEINFECVNLWFYPGAHLVHYPAGQNAKLNVVFNGPQSGPSHHLESASSNLKNLVAQIPNWTEWTAAHVHPLRHWHKGNILLIGDAAHGTLPYLAQGAAMALEDAAALLTTTDPVEFESLRMARCAKLHQQTSRVGKIYHFSGVKALARDTALRLTSDAAFLSRLAWLYKE